VSAARTFEAIGVPWRIDTAAPLPPEVVGEVDALIDRFDRDWSRFRTDGLVTALAPGGGTVPLPADGADLLGLYASLADATADAVTPLIGGSLASRGYDAVLGLVDAGPQPAPDWRRVLTWDAQTLRLTAPATIDVGAAGKGRLVDRVGELVRSRVAGPVTVDASGDVRIFGGSERIALEHPYDPTQAIGVWEVTDAALCASGVTRRAWGDGLHHVLDGRTGEPVRTVVATWAVAPTAMVADAAATALFFDGGPAWAHAHGVAWVRMTSAGAVEWSPGCDAALFRRG
jgi:FAD:protein FMN transferase